MLAEPSLTPNSSSQEINSDSPPSKKPFSGKYLEEPTGECRNCHEPGGDLIAPCNCSGSVKWVHRSCLNDWRAFSPNSRSFTHCDVCNYEYRYQIREDIRSGRVAKFVLRVCRDFLGAMIVVQAIIWFFTLICWAADRNSTLLNVFPKSWPEVGVYYIWGLFVFSLLAATYGALYLLYKCTCGKDYSGPTYYYYDYPYGWGPYYMWWYYPNGYSCAPMCGGCCGGHHGGGCCGGCDCGGGHHGGGNCGDCGGNCGGSSSNNNNDGLAIVALIILIVAITIGVIVMVVIAVIILRRHAHILQKQADAREMEVLDRNSAMY